ncbi:MAG: hypothetical protein Q8L37_01955 [Candidatus Gottesmanbacteria bacterium]|nr:hypothetical protein [Candidatus Gottesmanbacteria bacterium]
MDELPTCPGCHIAIRPTDYFCFNCGKNLHVVPPGTTPVDQIKLYAGSILLAPMGIFWGLKYLRENDDKAKIVGVIAMILSGVTFIIATQYTVAFINSLNSQVGQQLQGIEGF